MIDLLILKSAVACFILMLRHYPALPMTYSLLFCLLSNDIILAASPRNLTANGEATRHIGQSSVAGGVALIISNHVVLNMAGLDSSQHYKYPVRPNSSPVANLEVLLLSGSTLPRTTVQLWPCDLTKTPTRFTSESSTLCWETFRDLDIHQLPGTKAAGAPPSW